MMESPWDIDRELGLHYYRTESPGTGGVLRDLPEDFEVHEIAEHTYSEGPYLICSLKRRNWDQHRAIKAIASGLGISHQRIGFAGTKDKRAVTTQFISMYKIKAEELLPLSIPDITLTALGTSQHPIRLGDLQGNSFTIRIRRISDSSLLTSLEIFQKSIREGIPNYVGYQRFGVSRPVTHLIGFEILKGNYQEAVRVMIGKPGSQMEDHEQEGRACYLETEDAARCLHLLPPRLSLERSLLHHLVSNPGDFLGAILQLPRTLRSMYVSAVQSWIFNTALSMRIRDGYSLFEPEVGDHLIWPDGRTDTISPATIHAAKVQVKRNKCALALVLPGGSDIPDTGPDDRNINAILEEKGITRQMFEKVSSVLDTKFAGSFRPMLMKTDLTYEIIEGDLLVRFSLPPGQYATTILRELMKADPMNMV
ncbi:tRNA pseudouridine(13) synthase TruD [Methanospirillum hungatei]|jgi:tRNA pseudouridine13 synthase|uniref:tRNA pseudouridine(13) synthase TruD n=1 Tax=Methanospirillum hungatei TaxID=2203 RepID=UPI001B5504B8|nr:tRNA pseudouridine(13) synthase TruD [Methanospirillum hungatei]MBP9007757.1 tRNA pseudouridine(13) synthase TruD [Methanospirillum sp.]HOW04890.1 tRNA pseudouridine(13) synthase TruD [Methanospirillum hungatei]